MASPYPELVGFNSAKDKPIPVEMVSSRWERLTEGDTQLFKCKVHDTVFCVLVEPCWACYNEVNPVGEK